MKKFETWAYLDRPHKIDGRTGWIRTGSPTTRESCENAIAFAKQHNPTTRYEIREAIENA